MLNSLESSMLAEMKRYLPILEEVFADENMWEKFAKGKGIATLNGYKYQIHRAKNKEKD